MKYQPWVIHHLLDDDVETWGGSERFCNFIALCMNYIKNTLSSGDKKLIDYLYKDLLFVIERYSMSHKLTMGKVIMKFIEDKMKLINVS